MPRRGTFGRLPRAVPSITATVVAIAREQSNQEDQNIMDAWQKGGMFEGQKATDSLVLNHWRGRLANVAKDDPLYDTYKNTVTQYEYAIAESKMTVKYAQGKISEGGAAAFYSNWAKKIPKDSEFYRVLLRDAAQHIAAAKNKSTAAARALAEQQYQAGQTATYNKHEATADYLTSVLTNMATAKGIIQPGQSFSNFDLSDPGVMLDVMDTINGGVTGVNPGELRRVANPNQPLFQDPNTGQMVTAGQVQARLHELDPHFGGTVTLDYYAHTLRDQSSGQATRLAAATKTGHATDATRITGQQQNTVQIANNANAWPIEESYSKLNDVFMQTWGDANAAPQAKLAAWSIYSQGLGSLAMKATDPALASILHAEIDGNPNIETLKVQMGGRDLDGKTTSAGDGAATVASVEAYKEQVAAVSSGQGVWTLGGYDKTGAFTPGAGTVVGVASPEQIANISSGAPISVVIPQAGGLPPLTVQVVGKDIHARFTDINGGPVDTTTVNGAIVGQSYNLPNGTMVGISGGSDGKTKTFTMDAPWAAGVGTQVSPDGSLTLHVTNLTPDGSAAFAQTGVNSTTGSPIYGVANATGLVLDGARAATPNPLTDSHSPTVSYNVAIMGQAGLAQLVQNNPAVSTSIDNDLHFYTGATPQYDPKTNAIIGWVGGDTGSYSQSAYAASVLSGQHDTSSDIILFGPAGMTRALAPRDSLTPGFGQPTTAVVNPYTGFTVGQTADFSLLAAATPGRPYVAPGNQPKPMPTITTGEGIVLPAYPNAVNFAADAQFKTVTPPTPGANVAGPNGPGPQPFMMPHINSGVFGNVSSPLAQPPATVGTTAAVTAPYSVDPANRNLRVAGPGQSGY